jgi:hypothetical protein
MPKLTIEMQQVLKLQENYVKKVCKEISTLPPGSLYCSIRGSHNYYFHSIFRDGVRKKKYISIKNVEQAQLISNLKRKRFLLGCKKVLEGNVVALQACLMRYEEFDPAQISSQLAASYKNITDVVISQQESQNPQNPQNQQDQQGQQKQQDLGWTHAPYPRAEMHEENLKHEAIGGLWVRSKSEAMIAFALDLAHIPFHYEETLELDNKKIAPDFTILHPISGERVYWEHFGMMDDEIYATETFRKMILYGKNNIMPGRNLIYTMETSAEPLSIREIQGLITHHLLS